MYDKNDYLTYIDVCNIEKELNKHHKYPELRNRILNHLKTLSRLFKVKLLDEWM